jgi:hypothetical protein
MTKTKNERLTANVVFDVIISNSIVVAIYKIWVAAYRRHPLVTALASIVGVILIGTIVVVGQQNRKAEEERRKDSADFVDQLATLDSTQNNLRQIMEFVENQKSKLKESHDIVDSLEQKKHDLTPIVQAQKEIVDAIFAVQEKRQSDSVSRERWIGFGYGVLASIVASAIWTMVVFGFKKYRGLHVVVESVSEQPG